ncbi:MAG: DNA mismatch repair endonuclease MutL [Clostridia bacterium]|nr:DNA mismatch repair endonuclease MutL [Clostridia bacterium]
MGKIILLDEQTSCRIAAGEVVERPSSVVKELVENSIDAGSTRISVEIVKGGIKLIRVTDNGSGMEPDDCVIAFDKHATSKIRSADDLFSVTTMGFRGEALASIAAVAKVTLNTKTSENPEGTYVVIEGGDLIGTGSVGMSNGTRLTVENLFYNTPARYKFLKKDQTEASYVADVLEKIALANPSVSFTLISDKKQILYTPGGGNLRNAALGIFGREITGKLIDISSTAGPVTVTGLCGSKDLTFGNRGRQIFFVNGRYIRSKLITSAIDEAYKTLTMKGRFPFVILNISVPATSVDVNVHPAKTEVRFADESAIFRAVYHSIFDTLQGAGNAGVLSVFARQEGAGTFDAGSPSAVSPDKGANTGHTVPSESYGSSDRGRASQTVNESYIKNRRDVVETEQGSLFDTVAGKSPGAPEGSGSAEGSGSPEFYGMPGSPGTPEYNGKPEIHENKDTAAACTASSASEPDPEYKAGPQLQNNSSVSEEAGVNTGTTCSTVTALKTGTDENTGTIVNSDNLNVYRNGRVIGQLFDTYIIIELGTRMYLLDQHAAHERLKYEEIKNALQTSDNPSQMLLVPVNLRLSAKEISAYRDCEEFFARLGFEIEEFGGNSLVVRSVPTLIDREAVSDFIITALNSKKPGDGHVNVFPDYAVYTMACKAAIKANRRLSAAEIDALLKELIRVDNPGTCPHGRPILVSFTQYEIERRFHRA